LQIAGGRAPERDEGRSETWFWVAPDAGELLPEGGITAEYGSAQITWTGPKRDRIPPNLPQQTFQEMRNLATAMADGPSGRRWEAIDGEDALRHVIPDQPLQTKFSAGQALLEWWATPPSHERLRSELRQAGLPGVLLAHVAVGLTLRRYQVEASLDELCRAIGWNRREAALREEHRARIWRILLMLDSMPVIGKRPGRYRDPRTKELIDLVSVDAFIKITGKRLANRAAANGSQVPHDVSFVAGPWLEQYRGNRQVLSDFGDVLRIAAIPAGKPGGAWAQSVGLALNQRWRERAHEADTHRVGEDRHLTVRFRPFTRRDLLGLFAPSPTVDDVLCGPNPKRAQTYWDEAIKLLKQERLIGYYHELKPIKAGRQGWRDAWLNQPLDVRPTAGEREATAEIAGKATTARRRRGRPSKQADG
jgi:hypothetical protein